MNKKNLLVATLAAVLVGLFSLPTLNNITLPAAVTSLGIGSGATAAILAVLTLIGYGITELLGKWIGLFRQIGRFIITGALNTFLDLAVLNILISTSGIAEGAWASSFKGISFAVAVLNSYYWNKYWTFEYSAKKDKEFVQFLLVSAVGIGINVGTFSVVVDVFGPLGGIDATTWATVGALAGTFTGLFWNFIGYKFIVFKKKTVGVQ